VALTTTVKFVTWDEYASLLKEKLYDQVRYRQFDAIVAIGRGGSIIAAYLASKLGVPTYHTAFVRHVGSGDGMTINEHDVGDVSSLTGKVLVVDDSLIEGRAMRHVLNLLSNDASVTTLVMYNRRGSEFTPDIVGAYLDERQRDILFPYDPIG
jgi:hypoxanthine phosphoribosyltransferase